MRASFLGKVLVILLVAASNFQGRVLAQGRAGGLQITRLTANAYVYTTWVELDGAPFPANGLYVLGDSGAILVDSPWNRAQTEPLLDSIKRKHGQRVALCLATHSHDDRTGSLDLLAERGVRTWTSQRTHAISLKHGDKLARHQFRGDTTFRIGGVVFEAFYPGGGHTPDNIVVWFPAEKVLFGGCLVKSPNTQSMGNVADAVVQEWPMAIENLRLRYPDRRFVIPGHQGWQGDPLAHTLELLKRNWKELNSNTK